MQVYWAWHHPIFCCTTLESKENVRNYFKLGSDIFIKKFRRRKFLELGRKSKCWTSKHEPKEMQTRSTSEIWFSAPKSKPNPTQCPPNPRIPHSLCSTHFDPWELCSLKYQSIFVPKIKTIIVRIPSKHWSYSQKSLLVNISSFSGLYTNFEMLIINCMFALGPFPAGSWNKSFHLKHHGTAASAATRCVKKA